TPLHCACKNGDMKAVEMLVVAGADVNSVDHNTCTPLWLAVEAERTDIQAVEALLQAGADVNVGDFRDVQPVALACEEGQLDILNLLLQYNADV
ncbi:hypothetical protein LOTGIDRAFT_101234, partial [Lottia gigantea]